MSNWFTRLFIDEAKYALNRHSGSGSGSDSETNTYILVDESGAEIPAVLVDEVTVFDATANDIREGKIAATEDGVTVGTKEIPAYHTTEGARAIMPSKKIVITSIRHCDYTKLQAIVCRFNKSLTNSVAADKVSINSGVYDVGSTELLSEVTVDTDNKTIDLGIINETTSPCVIRFISYKEEL